MRQLGQVGSAASNAAVANVVTGPEMLESVLEFLRRHVVLVIATTFLAYAAWAAYLSLATPDFTGTAKVVADPHQAAVLSQQQSLSVIDTDEVPTEVNLLTSDSLAKKVVGELKLTQYPEFSQPGLPSRLVASLVASDRVPAQLRWIATTIERHFSPQVDPADQALRRTLNIFQRHLKIKPVASSHIIDVSFRSSDPKRAALIANAVATGLSDLELHAKSEATQQANTWSQGRLQELRSQLEAAQKELVGFRGTNDIGSQVRLRDLATRIATLRKAYDGIVQHNAESVSRQDFPVAPASVAAAAAVPLESNSPDGPTAFAVVSFIGLFVGFGIGLLRDMRDRTFRTPAQFEAALGLDCVAMVPKLHGKAAMRRLLGQANGPAKSLRETQLVEALRSIEVVAGLNRPGTGAIIIGVTSALAGEGKSTLAAALASHAARRGGRVLLIDCDLRNPSLSHAISPEASCGLSEVVRGTVSPEDAIRNGKTATIKFLPAGSELGRSDDHAMVDGPSMRVTLANLRQQYDVIFLDLPPLAPVIDAWAVAESVDRYLLVVEWGKTKIDVVEHALRSAKGLNEKLFGAVFNKVNFNRLTRYDRNLKQYYSADYFTSRLGGKFGQPANLARTKLSYAIEKSMHWCHRSANAVFVRSADGRLGYPKSDYPKRPIIAKVTDAF
ncbi:MAG TPA: AAA family ATPase [Xanthobacteraceae bacterium]|nr:AAA family ATPase [Xanthobacteraceae bacterium]